MNAVPEIISTYIGNNKICTCCFTDTENKPHCINCFYFFDFKRQLLVFKSSSGSTHSAYTRYSAFVSGTILPEQTDILKTKGLQFKGIVLNERELNDTQAAFNYHKKYPMALAIPGYIWAIRLKYLKFTDNTPVFGSKLQWSA